MITTTEIKSRIQLARDQLQRSATEIKIEFIEK